MYVRVPCLRDHSNLILMDLNDAQIQFACTDRWEIGVPGKRNLLWSIVLALLMPDKQSSDEFRALVQCLNGQNMIESENIKKSATKYNPFLDRHSCFHDQNLTSLVCKFEKIIENLVKNNYLAEEEEDYRDFMKHKRSAKYDEIKLETICLTLRCKILVIYEIYLDSCIAKLNEPEICFYPKEPTPGTNSWDREILLYCKTKENNGLTEANNRIFSLGLSEAIGSTLQCISLETILRPISSSLGIQQFNLQKLYELPGVRENFVITMLKSEKVEHKDIIYNLYKQPSSVLWRLSEAGFITNPIKGDLTDENQPNAFYYAILCGQIKALYLLYKHATSTPRLPDSSSRKTNPEILDNFKEISSSLTDARDTFTNFPQSLNGNLNLVYIEELIQVHDFQLAMRQKIFDINQRVDCDDDDFFEVEQRKDVLASIVSLYAERFYSVNMVRHRDCPSIEGYEHYVKYINYFQNLDSLSALFFFDHIFLLKDKLKLNGEQYENIESAFIRLVFTNKYFINNVRTSQEVSMQLPISANEESNILYRSPNLEDLNLTHSYLSRAVFEKKLIKFRDHLCSVLVSSENTSDIRHELAGYSLGSEPIIKDELILFRLNYYLNLTTELDFKDNNNVALFAIQRALQILGECVKPDTLDFPTVAKSFLVSTFTETLSKDLGRIRDYLLHHEMKQTQSRLDIEKDETFFRNIQQEIAAFLKINLHHLFQLQGLRTENYVYRCIFKMVEPWKRSEDEANVPTDSSIAEEDCGRLLNLMGGLLEGRNQTLETYRGIIQSQLGKIQEKLQEMLNSTNAYENHFLNHFLWIENHRNKAEKEAVKYRFICIQVLLRFLLEEISVDDPDLKCEFELVIKKTQDKLQNLHEESNKIKYSLSIKEMLDEYKLLKDDIYEAVKLKTFGLYTEEVTCAENMDNSAIHKFHLILKGFHFISDDEKESILSNVPDCYKNNHDILKEMHLRLGDSECETSSLILKVEDLEFSRTKKTDLEDIVRNCRLEQLEAFIDKNDNFDQLLKCLDASCLCIKERNCFCKTFDFNENTKKILGKITKGKRKPEEDRALDFFCNRVKNLKEMVIDNNTQIKRLWEEGNGSRSKRIIHDQIVQLYTQQPKLQAAVEFLLCDCMVLLKKKDAKLDCLWYKTNSLFNGMNLRNMLAHGNPLFEAVSKFFDPSDLPNEIIEKTLDLISDADAIMAIHSLQDKTRYTFGEFLQLVGSDNREHRKQIRQIKSCKIWQQYACLIPLNSTHN